MVTHIHHAAAKKKLLIFFARNSPLLPSCPLSWPARAAVDDDEKFCLMLIFMLCMRCIYARRAFVQEEKTQRDKLRALEEWEFGSWPMLMIHWDWGKERYDDDNEKFINFFFWCIRFASFSCCVVFLWVREQNYLLHSRHIFRLVKKLLCWKRL